MGCDLHDVLNMLSLVLTPLTLCMRDDAAHREDQNGCRTRTDAKGQVLVLTDAAG